MKNNLRIERRPADDIQPFWVIKERASDYQILAFCRTEEEAKEYIKKELGE